MAEFLMTIQEMEEVRHQLGYSIPDFELVVRDNYRKFTLKPHHRSFRTPAEPVSLRVDLLRRQIEDEGAASVRERLDVELQVAKKERRRRLYRRLREEFSGEVE